MSLFLVDCRGVSVTGKDGRSRSNGNHMAIRQSCTICFSIGRMFDFCLFFSVTFLNQSYDSLLLTCACIPSTVSILSLFHIEERCVYQLHPGMSMTQDWQDWTRGVWLVHTDDLIMWSQRHVLYALIAIKLQIQPERFINPQTSASVTESLLLEINIRKKKRVQFYLAWKIHICERTFRLFHLHRSVSVIAAMQSFVALSVEALGPPDRVWFLDTAVGSPLRWIGLLSWGGGTVFNLHWWRCTL